MMNNELFHAFTQRSLAKLYLEKVFLKNFLTDVTHSTSVSIQTLKNLNVYFLNLFLKSISYYIY
ncbi:MAG: hypothetical protein DRR16_33315 [Candidatus Parabeggiatoa sp. nov. 3]|nr:MAG: hypothetical protein DRR00_25080 [Gammaproteobacteria bacterium]RKZ60578.1 MAG: hypothetical protein DRQ99_21855 [Gammaproteobacteria bacterium]RKZ73189.1 MAG: hypothetical protein DRR16_33315 [Gammaproteobacteria bacterium]